jgi:hypothetical protein
LNLYVYVGNNPLKYRDPTGHVKETPEQEAMEEAGENHRPWASNW